MASNITEALRQCNSYAEKGYELAKSSYEEIHRALLKEEQKVNEANRRQNQMTRIANSSVLQRQNNNFEEFKRMDLELKRNLELLHNNQKEFSIVVFGRTMAGKSTLMETLKHGDGERIGKGAQRTTRDVRDYHWQGMKITDVPGIASFDGREDDRLAMEAAKKADLILFLITDDAPQKDEAEKLAELRSLGKPVLGIVNVKLALNIERKALALRNLQKKLSDTARLNEICKQFKAYATQFNQDWQEMPFIYTHLKAAFLGQSSQLNDAELYNMSNFPQVEKYIIDKVCKDGCFLRIKTFIDNVAVPMQQRMELLLEHSSVNVREGLIYREKHHKLLDWRSGFLERTKKKYLNFMRKLEQIIEDEINDFAESNYDNEYAGIAWSTRIGSLHLEKICSAFLQELSDEAERKRRELTDELHTEVKFSTIGIDASNIKMEGITDTQSIIQIGALGALGLGLIGAPIAIGIGLLAAIFGDSKEEKIRQRKRELKEQLHNAMKPVIDKIDKYILDEIFNNILEKGINNLGKMLYEMDTMFFELANDEQIKAKYLNNKLFKLNSHLWDEAIKYITSSNNMNYNIKYLSRIPGQISYGIGIDNIPTEICQNISALLDEKINYISLQEVDNSDINISSEIENIIIKWVGKYDDIVYGFDKSEQMKIMILEDSRAFEVVKNETNYRLMEQIRCIPISIRS